MSLHTAVLLNVFPSPTISSGVWYMYPIFHVSFLHRFTAHYCYSLATLKRAKCIVTVVFNGEQITFWSDSKLLTLELFLTFEAF